MSPISTLSAARRPSRRDRLYEEFADRLAQQGLDVPSHPEAGGRPATWKPGHMLAHPATAPFDVEWVVIADDLKGLGRLLVVAADAQALRGPGDLLVPGDEPCGALTVRCTVGLRVPAVAFARASLTGHLPAWCLRRVQSLFRKTSGLVRDSSSFEEPDYREHMVRLEEARRVLASWSRELGTTEPVEDGTGPEVLATTDDDRIGQLYDEIARLTSLEADSSSQALREAWTELRRLQREEARRDRTAFEASLAMPIDAGRRILEQARSSRRRFEDLAARHHAAD